LGSETLSDLNLRKNQVPGQNITITLSEYEYSELRDMARDARKNLPSLVRDAVNIMTRNWRAGGLEDPSVARDLARALPDN
jgi:hypothetical protein